MTDFESRIKQDFGWIEVICGCMFSGKTEALLQRIDLCNQLRLEVGVFKSAVDVRYATNEIVSHKKNAISAIAIFNADDIANFITTQQIIAIDEAQFFDTNIVNVCVKLANEGKKVIISGLDMDYKGHPFGAMPQLLAVSDYVSKLHAICSISGLPASFSKRILPSQNQILLGQNEAYQPRNRKYLDK